MKKLLLLLLAFLLLLPGCGKNTSPGAAFKGSVEYGGLVYSTSNGTSKSMGIHHGYWYGYSAFCKVANIALVLNVSPIG